MGILPQTTQTHFQLGKVAPNEYTRVIPALTVKAPDPPNMPLKMKDDIKNSLLGPWFVEKSNYRHQMIDDNFQQ